MLLVNAVFELLEDTSDIIDLSDLLIPIVLTNVWLHFHRKLCPVVADSTSLVLLLCVLIDELRPDADRIHHVKLLVFQPCVARRRPLKP